LNIIQLCAIALQLVLIQPHFYVWEGSEDSGFQLRVFTLEQKNGEPNVVSGTINSNEHKDPSGGKKFALKIYLTQLLKSRNIIQIADSFIRVQEL